MPIQDLRRALAVLLLSPLLFHASPALATSSVARGPSAAGIPGSIEADGLPTGYVEVVNGPLWLGYDTYHITNTEAYADDTTGLLRGAARFQVTADNVGPQPYSFFTTNTTGTGEVAGPPGVPQRLVATFAIHGRLSDLSGAPGIALQSTLVVAGPASDLLTSDLSFERAEGTTTLSTFTHAFAGTFPGEPYPGAQPIVLSTALDDLRGIARIEFFATAGEELFLEANVFGAVGPEGSATNAQFSSASVDFLQTGVLRLELPPGVSLINTSGALASAEVVVPEPGTTALALSGALALAFAGSHRGSRTRRRSVPSGATSDAKTSDAKKSRTSRP